MVAKYKVGDYLVKPHTEFIRVMAVVEDGDQPLYGLYDISKHPNVIWLTEYDLDMQKAFKKKPDFEIWRTLKTGDYVKDVDYDDKENDSTGVRKVLAVVGEVALLSRAPIKAKEVKQVENLLNELNDLGGADTDEDVKKVTQKVGAHFNKALDKVKPYITTKGAYSSATQEWITFDQLALSDMELIRE